MKTCTSCAKELPDAAMHCVFCGTKQPAPPAGANAKTVMGWQAGDLLKEAGLKPAAPPPAAPPPAAPPPAAPPPAAPPRAPSAPGDLGSMQTLASPGGSAGGIGAMQTLAAPGGNPGGIGAMQTLAAPGGNPGGIGAMQTLAAPGPQPASAAGPQPPAAAAAKTVFAAQAPVIPPPGPGAAAYPPSPTMPAPSAYGPGPGAAAYPPSPTMPAPSSFGGPPGPAPSPAASAATMFAAPAPSLPPQGPPPGAGFGGPLPGAGMPPQPGFGGPQPGFGAPPQPGFGGGPIPGAGMPPQPGFGGPQPGFGGGPIPGAGMPPQPGYGGPAPLPPVGPAPVMPPYLASRTAARAGAPREPFSEGLRLVLIVFGALLLVAFAAPLALKPATVFRWDVLSSGASASVKFDHVYLAAAGVLALVFGLVPLATVPRGLLAAVLGLTPMAFHMILKLKAHFDWRELAEFVGLLCLVAGLLLRQEYRSQLLPRVLTTIGAVATLAVYLVPINGDPPIKLLIDGVSAAEGKGKLSAILELYPFILAFLSLLVWLPAPSSAAAKVLAWLLIVSAVVVTYTNLLIAGHIGNVVKFQLNTALFSGWIAAAWLALVGYGVATVLGKNLEHA